MNKSKISNNTPRQGLLFIIVAPSGAGKTSLVHALIDSVQSLSVSVSHTTRPMRPGEIDGQNYFFINESRFNEMVAQDLFLEHATVFGLSYGTSKKWVIDQLALGIDVILEIDWQGAKQVKSLLPNCVGIFILPPTLKSLEERLHKRGQDSDEVIRRRLLEAQTEMQHATDFDYVVINEDFETALSDLKAIIRADRLNTRQFCERRQDLLKSLLSSQ